MTEQNGSVESASETIRRRRALIVDDEAGVRESLRMVLKDAYDLVLAASGAEKSSLRFLAVSAIS